jgi:hypothetical protein
VGVWRAALDLAHHLPHLLRPTSLLPPIPRRHAGQPRPARQRPLQVTPRKAARWVAISRRGATIRSGPDAAGCSRIAMPSGTAHLTPRKRTALIAKARRTGMRLRAMREGYENERRTWKLSATSSLVSGLVHVTMVSPVRIVTSVQLLPSYNPNFVVSPRNR